MFFAKFTFTIFILMVISVGSFNYVQKDYNASEVKRLVDVQREELIAQRTICVNQIRSRIDTSRVSILKVITDNKEHLPPETFDKLVASVTLALEYSDELRQSDIDQIIANQELSRKAKAEAEQK